ncbi:MAG: 30S ribosome-binding factor RbfA [Mycobacteriales bacterium]
MTDAARVRRFAVQVRHIVAEVLQRRVKDPRIADQLRLVTVTDARVSGDLHEVTVYYTVLGEAADRREVATALESAKGLVRTAIGRNTGVKFTPTVNFVADAVLDEARHIEDLLVLARQADAHLDEARRSAEPAGDAQPYRDGT